MTEDSSEKRIGRRSFLALLGLGTGVVLGVDRLARAKSDLTNPENLRQFLGGNELFPHTNYSEEVVIGEGIEIFEQPRMSKPEEVGGLATTKVGSGTSMGILGQGESIKVSEPFLFLKEADQFTDPAWIKDINGPGGEIRKANVLRSWLIFSTRGTKLPSTIRGVSEYEVACVPIQKLGLDFQKLFFSQEVNLGRVIS